MIEEVPAITYTWDPTGPAGTVTVPYVSPQIETVLGFTQREWTSDPMLWIEHLHPDDRARVVAESDRTDLTGEPFAMEYRIQSKDGREVWLRDESVVVARDASGRHRLVRPWKVDASAMATARPSATTRARGCGCSIHGVGAPAEDGLDLHTWVAAVGSHVYVIARHL